MLVYCFPSTLLFNPCWVLSPSHAHHMHRSPQKHQSLSVPFQAHDFWLASFIPWLLASLADGPLSCISNSLEFPTQLRFHLQSFTKLSFKANLQGLWLCHIFYGLTCFPSPLRLCILQPLKLAVHEYQAQVLPSVRDIHWHLGSQRSQFLCADPDKTLTYCPSWNSRFLFNGTDSLAVTGALLSA